MEQKLQTIFNYYKSKYKLNTSLILITLQYKCVFRSDSNSIIFNLNYVKSIIEDIKLLSEVETENNNIIFALLHEIGHSIDFTLNHREFMNDLEHKDNLRYKVDYEYAVACPSEQRATKIAKEEIQKWI